MKKHEYTPYRVNPETMESNVEQPHRWGAWVRRQEVDKLLDARDVKIKRLKKKNKKLKNKLVSNSAH
jgi:hypothetical protein